MLEDENKWLNFSEIYFEGPKSNTTTADYISDKFDNRNILLYPFYKYCSFNINICLFYLIFGT